MRGSSSPGRPTRRERELLVEALFLYERPRSHLARLARDGIAWPRVLHLARDRGVLGTLACALLGERLEQRLDAPSRRALCEAYENACAQNGLLLHELGRIQAALDAAGIRSVALKGAALLARHYPALGARHADDLDLLVAPGSEADAARALGALGYARPPGVAVEPGGQVVGLSKVLPSGVHLPRLFGPGGVLCDVHVRLPGADPATAVEPILARAVTEPFGGATLRVAAPVDLLAIGCQHVVDGHQASPRYLLRHVCDLHALLATTDVRWEEAREAHPGARSSIEASLRLLRDAGRPGGRGAPGSRRRAATLTSARAFEVRWRRLARGLRVLRWTWGRSPAELGRLLVPARAFMAARYGVDARSPAIPFLYLFRPLRAGWRLVTGR